MKRRDFLKFSLSAGAFAVLTTAGLTACQETRTGNSAIQLPPLPYKKDALEPYISQKTLEFHYGKHHQGYVNKLNTLIAGTKYAEMPLEEIVKATQAKSDESAIFNNAAQVFNHTFYWNSMKSGGGGKPQGQIERQINEAFGGYKNFSEQFSNAATSQFGSGWAWLVRDGETLKVMNTANADTPIAHGLNPILTIDIWEHAYYLDYQNRRADYVQAYLDHLANWDFVENNLKA
jgi:Fe-Mn family superoxide dismutase